MGIKETSRFNTKRNSEQLLTRPRPDLEQDCKNIELVQRDRKNKRIAIGAKKIWFNTSLILSDLIS